MVGSCYAAPVKSRLRKAAPFNAARQGGFVKRERQIISVSKMLGDTLAPVAKPGTREARPTTRADVDKRYIDSRLKQFALR